MGAAEIIAFEEVRASKQWDALRRQLHTRFDQWLDELEAQLHEPAPTLAQVTETVWHLRQALTGGLTETLVEHTHQGEHTRRQSRCPQCDRLLPARPAVRRTVETLVGLVTLERPSCYCAACRVGLYPLDEVLALSPGRTQLDVPQAAIKLVTEVP
jgi:exonuclease VII large subunit